MRDERVVSAWSDECPLCTEGRAFFMVHADGEVSLRCPGCQQNMRLNESQEWELVYEYSPQS